MAFMVQSETPPLHEDSSGALRVGTSRVLLELVIHAFEDGATPEAIVQRYPTLSLRDVYSVIAYYLRHRDEVGAYLHAREQSAAMIRDQIEKKQSDIGELRTRLQAQRAAHR